MEIKVLGSGCSKCNALYKNIHKAVDDLKLNAIIEKVEDINEILKYEILRTPALVVDEKVIKSGESPGLHELKFLLTELTKNEQ